MAKDSILVLGAGAMGTAISYLLSGNGNDVVIWSRRQEICNQINRHHQNPQYVHGFNLPEKLHASTDLESALKKAEFLVLAIPSHAIKEVCLKMQCGVSKDSQWLSVEKGLTLPDCSTSSEVLNQTIGLNDDQVAALSGPNFASEIVNNVPTISVVGSKSNALATYWGKLLENDNFIVKTSTDLRGVEVSGALKNIGAIAIGIVDGLDLGDNTRGLVFSYYIHEALEIGTIVFGAKPETLLGFACLGDMVTTSFSNKSRNRIIGLLASKCITQIPQESFISEGKNTANALITLGAKYNLELPTVRFVYSVLNGENPLEAFNLLFKSIKNSE